MPWRSSARTDAFRQLIARRSLLVVLDHVSDAGQVAPLLTDDENVFTVVVAASPIPGLPLAEKQIGPLDSRFPLQLVSSITGKKRISAARRKSRATIRLCGGSPFALRALGEYMRRHPQRSWAEAEGELRALAPGVPEGDSMALMVRWIHGQLDATAKRLLTPLVARPWPSFTSALVAQAVGVSQAEAERVVEDLVARRLMAPCGLARYTIRASVRQHLADVMDCDVDRHGSTVRALVDAYLRMAVSLDYAALPDRWHLNPLYVEAKRQARTE